MIQVVIGKRKDTFSVFIKISPGSLPKGVLSPYLEKIKPITPKQKTNMPISISALYIVFDSIKNYFFALCSLLSSAAGTAGTTI